jgi:hypothetical protein
MGIMRVFCCSRVKGSAQQALNFDDRFLAFCNRLARSVWAKKATQTKARPPHKQPRLGNNKTSVRGEATRLPRNERQVRAGDVEGLLNLQRFGWVSVDATNDPVDRQG